MTEKYFYELDQSFFQGRTIILDIDGTIVPDGGDYLETRVREKLLALKKQNKIYFCSNKIAPVRNKKLSESSGVAFLESKVRKPNKGVIASLGQINQEKIVVIGDKVLTDGLLARRLGAEFLKVKRLVQPQETFFVRLTNKFDDFLSLLSPWIEILRPNHWIKNLFIFIPLFFAGQLFSTDKLMETVMAFVIFSLAASSVYILNDIFDCHTDRLHPFKRHRPLASGRLSLNQAVGFFLGLSVVVLFLTILELPQIMPLLLLYWGLNFLYSARLKTVPVLELLLISSFYLLRLAVGGVAAGVPLTTWLFVCSFFAAFFIITGKRRSEYAYGKRRRVLEYYSLPFLNQLLVWSAGLSFLSYFLYVWLEKGGWQFLSLFFVALGILRFLYIMYSGQRAEFPEKVVLTDFWLLFSLVGWLVLEFFLFY